jgi:hypothetical protein
MKRFRITLLSIAVIAIVGAALAFKAKGGIRVCALETTGSSCAVTQTCGTLISNKKTSTSSSDPKYCTTDVPISDNCSGVACGTDNPVTLTND